MRSTRLLFLLITTQSCLISTESNINSLEGTARFIRDTTEFTLAEQDELNGLSTNDLKIKLNQAQDNFGRKETEKTRIQGELETARKASEAANTTLVNADRDWRAALEEKERLEKPMKELVEDVNAKKTKLRILEDALSQAARKVRFPSNVGDKKKHALNASNFAQQTLSIVKERVIVLEREIKTQLTNARDEKAIEKDTKEEDLINVQKLLRDNNCPEGNVKQSKAAIDRRKRITVNCTLKWQEAQSAQKILAKAESELEKANADLDAASNELTKKQDLETDLGTELKNWQRYIAASNNVTLATEEIADAKSKLKDSKELTAAKNNEKNARDAFNSAKEAPPRLAAEYTRLEAKFTAAETEAENAKSIRDRYQSKYNNQTSSTPVDTAGPPWLLIGGGVAVVAVVAVVASLFYCCWKKKRGRKEEVVKDDPCLVVADGTLIPDEKLFQYKDIVQCDAYEGDLPHDKAGEQMPRKPPTDYIYDKDRLFYSHNGLEPPIKTGKKIPTEIVEKAKKKAAPIVGKRYVAVNFFQPQVLGEITEFVALKWIKTQRNVLLPEEYMIFIRLFDRPKDYDKICRGVVLDKANVRGEFLHYLHTMAAAPCKDNDPTSRFYVEVTHILWICSNVRRTLEKYHPTQLLEFSGSVVVVGQIHGQFPDLLRMFASRATAEKPGWLTHNYIFLGDYADRGTFSLETIIFLFLLKILYPLNIILLRGHYEDLMYNGFYEELNERYPQCKKINTPIICLSRLFKDIFDHLPVAALLNGNVFLAHGGITEGLVTKHSKSLKKYYSKVPMPFTDLVTDTNKDEKEFLKAQTAVKGTIWNDPDPASEGFVDNDGSGHRFGPGPFSAFKRRHGIVMMMRGHQMTANGVRYPFNERTLIQIFSAPNYEENNKEKKKNMNNRACTIDFAADGSMGIHIYGRLESIKTKEEALEAFRKNHRIGKGMIGDDVEGDLTQRVVLLEETDKNKVVEKTAEDKPSDKDKKALDKDKKMEEKDKKVEEKDKKVEEKDKKEKENKLLPEKTAEDKEDQVNENKNDVEEKTAEAPGKDEFPNIPPPSI